MTHAFRRILIAALLVLGASAPGVAQEIQCRPNIFGGQDITGPGGHVTTCRPNVFGGQDCR